VHTTCLPASQDSSQHIKCWKPYAVIYSLALLKMSIMVPEIFWANGWLINHNCCINHFKTVYVDRDLFRSKLHSLWIPLDVTNIELCTVFYQGTRCRSWLRHCTTRLRVTGFDSRWCYWRDTSGRIMTLGSTHPVTEIGTRNIFWY